MAACARCADAGLIGVDLKPCSACVAFSKNKVFAELLTALSRDCAAYLQNPDAMRTRQRSYDDNPQVQVKVLSQTGIIKDSSFLFQHSKLKTGNQQTSDVDDYRRLPVKCNRYEVHKNSVGLVWAGIKEALVRQFHVDVSSVTLYVDFDTLDTLVAYSVYVAKLYRHDNIEFIYLVAN